MLIVLIMASNMLNAESSVLLPSVGSIFMNRQNIPIVGEQVSIIKYLPDNRVELTMSGIMKLEKEIVSYEFIDGQIVYTELPSRIQEQMKRLHTTLLYSLYDNRDDTVKVAVKPPIIPSIKMIHHRVQ